MIIDANSSNLSDPVVWTGSFNFSRNQSDIDYNNIIIFQDKPLAQAYYAEFNKMWGSTTATPNAGNSKFGPFKTPSAQTSYTVNGTPVEVYFSPKDNTTAKLINCINSCNFDLFFGIYTFTDTTVANAIINKKNAGMAAKGIMDSYSQTFTPYTTLSPVLGSNLRVYSSSGTYHNKMMLVDAGITGSDPQVFTGSHNWSISADTKNDENSVVVHDAIISNQYYQSLCKNFTDVGGTACAAVGVENFDYGQQQIAVYPNPAKDFMNIKVKNCGDKMKVALVNSLGQTLLEKQISGSDETSFDVGDLTPGLYFITVFRGDRSFTEKFLKQ